MNNAHQAPFDREAQERKLNKIFAQLADDSQGVRNNAATAIHEWMQAHRHVDHGCGCA